MTTIAVIGGTGKEGKGLALRWAHAGHSVIIGSRDAARAETAASELNGLLNKDSCTRAGQCGRRPRRRTGGAVRAV